MGHLYHGYVSHNQRVQHLTPNFGDPGFCSNRVWDHLIGAYDILGWSSYLFLNDVFWPDLWYSSLSEI